MAVTIKDVAALAGVSPSTVSRTCKDNPSISCFPFIGCPKLSL